MPSPILSARGALGAHVLHATHDSRELTQKARQAFHDRFLVEVDPNNELPEAERQRRAEHARKAFYKRLALASAKARAARAKKSGRPVNTNTDQAA